MPERTASAASALESVTMEALLAAGDPPAWTGRARLAAAALAESADESAPAMESTESAEAVPDAAGESGGAPGWIPRLDGGWR
jgi:hypothetical protein